jgi:hypothetical protein
VSVDVERGPDRRFGESAGRVGALLPALASEMYPDGRACTMHANLLACMQPMMRDTANMHVCLTVVRV